ncbi:MAG TPA: hypothetical protein VMP01_01680 [Pirellulaceae bacterium]|nr:hypothetical protein [Pirellulaceae bacterium]
MLASSGHPTAVIPVSQSKLEEIRVLSQRLFPGPISIRIGCDPEHLCDSWIVFEVEAQGAYADFRDREFQWYESVARIVAHQPADLRLCILPKP